jgi:hypothetical protein
MLFFGYVGFGKHILAISNVEAANNDAVFLHVSDFESARTSEGLMAIMAPTPEKKLKFRRGFSANTVNAYDAQDEYKHRYASFHRSLSFVRVSVAPAYILVKEQ